MQPKQLDFDKLKISITEVGDCTIYKFSGEVDESFINKQVPRPATKEAIFELAQIENFNSCGIREWIYFVRDLDQNVRLIFKECSVAMIDQINMVPESRGHAQIESFYAPYYSSSQGEVNKLISKEQIQEILKTGNAPEFKDESGKALEFDALEESYFLFLQPNPISKAS